MPRLTGSDNQRTILEKNSNLLATLRNTCSTVTNPPLANELHHALREYEDAIDILRNNLQEGSPALPETLLDIADSSEKIVDILALAMASGWIAHE